MAYIFTRIRPSVFCGTITEPGLPVANFSRSLGGYSTKAQFTQIRISFTCKRPIFLHEYGLPCTPSQWVWHRNHIFLKPHSEWFMAASTLIQIEKCAVSKVSGFLWSRSKFYGDVTRDDSKRGVTRDDSQRRFLAQHSAAMLEQCCNHSKRCCNAVLR